MEFTVACNWDFDLLDKIDYPGVKSLFGGLPGTLISSGRPSFMLSSLSYEDVKEYIKRVHSKGWKFDYNINATCLSNMEFSLEGYNKILKYIEQIVELGVDSLTISLPSLLEIVKKHFPHIKVKVSTFQKINSVSMAQSFEDMGADAIMLSEHINRDFKLLSAIRKSIKAKIILVANVGCVYGCANIHSHPNNVSHESSGEHRSIFATGYYQSLCMINRVKNPVEFIKSRWIRPEDVGIYEDIGIDMLKIVERSSTSQALGERVKAYSERCYNGNLIDLLGQMPGGKHSISRNVNSGVGIKGQEEMMKTARFAKAFFIHELSDLFYIDSNKIPEDFIKGFMERDCSKLSCKTCNYCKKISDECLTHADQKIIDDILKSMSDVKEEVLSGSILY
ncbi:MAG TPA: U32 family peptidase [Clostridia bacterium]